MAPLEGHCHRSCGELQGQSQFRRSCRPVKCETYDEGDEASAEEACVSEACAEEACDCHPCEEETCVSHEEIMRIDDLPDPEKGLPFSAYLPGAYHLMDATPAERRAYERWATTGSTQKQP